MFHKDEKEQISFSSQIYIHFNSYCGIGDLLQCVLQKAGNWRFNAFTLETVTGGKQLKYEIMKKEKLRLGEKV